MRKRQRMKEEREITLLTLIIPIIVVILIGSIDTVKAGVKWQLNTAIIADVANAYDFNKF